MPRQLHKRTRSKADTVLLIKATESQLPEWRQVKREDEPPAGFKALENQLTSTHEKETMWFDWTKTGASTYDECLDLLRYASTQTSDLLFLDGAASMQLCCPLFVKTEELTETISENSSTEPDPVPTKKKSKKGSSRGTRNACTRGLGPVCFKYLGEWKNADLIGNFEKELKPKLQATSWKAKNDCLAQIKPGTQFKITPAQKEGAISYEFKKECLDKISFLLNSTGIETSIPPEVGPGDIRGGELTAFTKNLKEDLFMVCVPDQENYFPLLSVEIKKPHIRHIVRGVRSHYFSQRGGTEPPQTITVGEQTQCVSVMTQLLQYCLAFGMEEIVLWDGVTVVVFKFDLVEQKRAERRVERKEGTAGKNDFAQTIGEVGFWSRVIPHDSSELPVSYVIMAMVWRQLKMMKDEAEYSRRRSLIKQTADHLFMTEDMIADIEYRMEQAGFHDKTPVKRNNGKRHKATEDNWGGSSPGKHVAKLEFEPIQDGDYLQRVLRMQKDEYQELFPNAKTEAESVVVKVFDIYSLELYYDAHRENDFFDLPLGELMETCSNRYRVEVGCYKRISLYNSMNQRKINVPKLLDFGFCCFMDDCNGSIFGLYLVMEDLGECVAPPEDAETRKMIDEQLSLHHHIGITHGDVAPRNMTIKDGKLFFFDFERATLGQSHNIFV